MSAFDSSFRKIAGEAKILAPGPACRAVVVRAGPTDHRHDEVADFNARDVRADFDDFPQRLMADDQVGGSGRRCAVFEGADLSLSVPQTPASSMRSLTSVGEQSRGSGISIKPTCFVSGVTAIALMINSPEWSYNDMTIQLTCDLSGKAVSFQSLDVRC